MKKDLYIIIYIIKKEDKETLEDLKEASNY